MPLTLVLKARKESAFEHNAQASNSKALPAIVLKFVVMASPHFECVSVQPDAPKEIILPCVLTLTWRQLVVRNGASGSNFCAGSQTPSTKTTSD